jgi:hypothetical protein
LQAQGISPSTALEQAKQVFETELEGIKKRLEDDMNQTKQLLAYGTNARRISITAQRWLSTDQPIVPVCGPQYRATMPSLL